MKDQIRNFLKSLAACPQLMKLYSYKHPEVEKAFLKSYEELKLILDEQDELVIAIIGNEFASGDDIFFDLSKKLNEFISMLTSRGAEKITFFYGATKEEFKDFFLFFIMPEFANMSINEYFDSRNISKIKVSHIGSINEDKDIADKSVDNLSVEEKYADCITKISASMTNIIEDKSVNFANFYLVMDGLAKGLGSHYQEILRLAKLKEKDTVTFAHLINVSSLSIYFSKKLGFNNDELRNIGMAALFHDIGKLYISNTLLKGGKLTDEEFENIKSHSLLGSKILLTFVDKLGILPSVVALEHHLKYDSSGGYPKLRFPHKLHTVSMIVSLCDVYDALSQKRSYKQDYPPEQIYNIMKQGRGSQFHPKLFDAFFGFIGVWPNGTIVQLSNDKIAIIKSQNEEKIFSPEIEIVSDSSKQNIDLSKDSQITIKDL